MTSTRAVRGSDRRSIKMPLGESLVSVLSTAPLSASDRAECWHEMVSRTFIPLDVNLLENEPSPGTIVSDQLGALQISVSRRDRKW